MQRISNIKFFRNQENISYDERTNLLMGPYVKNVIHENLFSDFSFNRICSTFCEYFSLSPFSSIIYDTDMFVQVL